jgi:NOL1/NOP2/fmu family ribosome biogenesis protein
MFEHRRMSGAVFDIRVKGNPTRIEADIKTLIAKSGQLQKDRYEADYNVSMIWSHTDVVRSLELAGQVFTIWQRIRKEDLAQNHLMSMFGARPN